MNEDILEGRWNQLKGKIKEQWGDLTDAQITKIEGHKDRLIGVLQERYGMSRDEASRQANNWWARYASPPESASRV